MRSSPKSDARRPSLSPSLRQADQEIPRNPATEPLPRNLGSDCRFRTLDQSRSTCPDRDRTTNSWLQARSQEGGLLKTGLQQIDRLYTQLPTINCKGLCVECCGPICMTDMEADRISKQVPDFPLKKTTIGLESGQVLGEGYVSDCLRCPLLSNEGRCTVYSIRPLICRLWGMVQSMRCPFGCTPSRWVTPRESFKLLSEAERISKRSMPR